MRGRSFALPLVLLAALVSSCSTAKKDNSEDWNKLQGRWKVEQALKSGKPMGTGIAYVEVQGDEMNRITTEGVAHRRIRIDALAVPPTMDFEILDEKDKGHVMMGIYKFEKEKLWLCHSPVGKPRPAAFKSTPDDGNVMAILRPLSERTYEKD